MFGRKTEADAPRNEPMRQDPTREEPRLRGIPRPAVPTPPLPRSDAARLLAEAAALRRPEPATEASAPSAELDPKELVIDLGITLTGEIHACDRLVVEGRVEGSLSDARSLEVVATGQFKGRAVVDSAVIAGRFEGELTARRQLVIRLGGQVRGTIRCRELEVERGGRLAGNVEQIAAAPGATGDPERLGPPGGQ
jgi:cytoskeletal protein CcmA (bactofilin family)